MIPKISDICYIHNFPRNTQEYVPDKFCIAYQIHNGILLNFGVSICSHKDHYNKKIGREYAIQRLQIEPTEIDLDTFKKIAFDKPNCITPNPNTINIFFNNQWLVTDLIHLSCIKTFFDFKRSFLHFVLKKYISIKIIPNLKEHFKDKIK